ncbi:MAG: hypothetical protein K0R10_638 [Alphaproteobacteria bacterium]|jgi:hypothetical protein|nr:hypothetical protein [Alphaproteobacteria bacterium]
MSGSQFSITNAVRNAYIFVGRERVYLARLALLPVGVDALTKALVFTNGRDMTIFESFSWSLPSAIMTGWFMFHLSRLLMMGERANNLPSDTAYLAARQQGMNACILIWLLFSMGWVALQGFQGWAMNPEQGVVNIGMATISMLFFGAAFWCVRYGLAHILAAVNYPISKYIRRVAGLSISFRIAGMGLLAALPVIACFYFVTTLILPPDVKDMYDPRLTPIVVLSAPVQMIITAIMTAAGAFALKEIMERPTTDERA